MNMKTKNLENHLKDLSFDKFFIEDFEIFDRLELDKINKMISNMPFYLKSSTSEKFKIYNHNLVSRPNDDFIFTKETKIEINSDYFNYFKKKVDLFCAKHKITYKNIIRADISSTFYVPNYFCGDPHVDFSKPHIVLIMYLSKISSHSKTLIFNLQQQFDNVKPILDIDTFFMKKTKIKKEILPQFGKVVSFDGSYYHSNKHPLPGENRIVCVFNLLI